MIPKADKATLTTVSDVKISIKYQPAKRSHQLPNDSKYLQASVLPPKAGHTAKCK